jgi:hypothetical protein
MQLIWYLPSLLIGLSAGIGSGYWQLALISVLMLTLVVSVKLARGRYPKFEAGAPIEISLGSVAIGESVLPAWGLFWKQQWHQLLLTHFQDLDAGDHFRSILLQKSAAGFKEAGELSFWLGVSAENSLALDLATEGPHLLIVGPTGSGKSQLMRLILISTLASRRLSLVLFDFKGGATLKEFEAAALTLATDLDPETEQLGWQLVSRELADREKLFAAAQVSSIEEYVGLGKSLDRMLVVVDEFATALNSGPLALQTCQDLAARGRSLGVHLVAATQSLGGISRAMLTNLRTRIAMASSDPIDLVQLGINPNRIRQSDYPGWGSALVARSNQPPASFNFPLGISPVPTPAIYVAASAPAPPVRSQLLRHGYSSPEPEPDLLPAPASNPDSRLLSRMEGLRS